MIKLISFFISQRQQHGLEQHQLLVLPKNKLNTNISKTKTLKPN